MPQKQLIIHVGFHKSGTSALQESFDAERLKLESAGILYPNIGRKAHHRLAWALTQRPWGWKSRGGETTPLREWSKLARRINRSKSPTVLLSSEFFSELSGEQIARLSSSIRGREIKILFTLRPLAKLLGSSYQQYLKYGLKAEYEKWLHAMLDNPGESKTSPTFWKRHSHGQVVGRWAEAFGPGSVTVLMVDEAKPEFLFDSVNNYLGLEPGFLKPQATGSNRSLSLEEISLLLEINRQFPKERSWQEYLVFIRNGYVRELTDHVPLRQQAEKLPTPAWAIARANELASKSKQEILSLGVRVIGDIESLDSAQVPEGEPIYPEVIDIQTVARAMLGFNIKTVRKFPFAWLKQELKRKLKRALGLGRGNSSNLD